MTEGIIQKVLAEFFYDCPIRQKMEKRLIQEIDKASRLYGCTCWIETAALVGEAK